MADASLKFLLFGTDMTASKAFEKVGVAAEKSSGTIKGAFAGSKGAIMTLGGVAAGLGFAAAQAGKFQQSTNVLVTAAGETTAGLKLVRKGILDISTSTGTSWQNVTDGMYLLEKAGYRGADAIKVETAAAQGAREENANLGTVTQAMTSIMASYGLKASDSVAVMNELKTAAGESKTTMENFAGALSTVLPVASANKISFADVAGAMATLTQHGTSADEATQELSNTIRGLSAPNAVAQKAMAQLGISSVDVATNLGSSKRGLTGTLAYLAQTVLGKMGPAGTVLLNTFNQSKAAAAAATTELNAMDPATRKLSQAFAAGSITQGEWIKAVKGLTPQQASLAKQFAATENNAKGFSTQLRNGLSKNVTFTDQIKKMTGGANGLNTTLQIMSGENLPATQARTAAIAKSFTGAGKSVEGWQSTQKLMNVQMDRLKATAQAAAITVGTQLLPPLTHLAEFLLRNKTAVELVVAAIITFKVLMAVTTLATKAWTAVQALFNDEMDANPISIVVLAIAALVVGLIYAYNHFTTFRNIINDIFSELKRWGPLALAVLMPFIGIPLLIWQHWSTIKAWIVKAASMVWAELKQWGPLALTVLAPFIGIPLLIWQHFGAIKSYVNSAFSAAYGVLKSWIGAMVSAITAIPGEIAGTAGQMLNSGKNLMVQFWNGIRNGAGDIGAFVSDLAADIKDGINNILGLPMKIHIDTKIPGVPTFDGTIIPALAKGGPARPGQPYLVGELGPELVTFGHSSYVHTASKTRKIAHTVGAANAASTADVHFNVYVSGQVYGSVGLLAKAVLPELQRIKGTGTQLGLA